MDLYVQLCADVFFKREKNEKRRIRIGTVPKSWTVSL
jgi:hypothetical protein